MKNTILLLVSLVFSAATLMAQDWQTDFTKAKEMATDENRPIVLVFQGSDWCAPCIKLDKEIWSTEEFKNYSKEHFVLLQADFPRRRANNLSDAQNESNAKLAEAYNKRGIFPFVVVLDNNGNVLGETGYKKTTPMAYISELNKFVQ